MEIYIDSRLTADDQSQGAGSNAVAAAGVGAAGGRSSDYSFTSFGPAAATDNVAAAAGGKPGQALFSRHAAADAATGADHRRSSAAAAGGKPGQALFSRHAAAAAPAPAPERRSSAGAAASAPVVDATGGVDMSSPSDISCTESEDDKCLYEELKKITYDQYDQYYKMNGNPLYKVKVLGEGSLGKVWGLSDEQKIYSKVKYAVKESLYPNDPDFKNEIKMIKKLELYKMFESSELCSIIMAHVIDDRRIAMCPYENLSTVFQHFREDKDNLIRAIFKQLVETAKCLYKNNLVYIDYKCENILYKCTNGIIKVYYADLGSLFDRPDTGYENNEYPVSFSYPDIYANVTNVTSYVSDKLMVWGIAITCLDLYSTDNDSVENFLNKCHWSARKIGNSNYDQNWKRILQQFIKGLTIFKLFPKDVATLLVKMLDLNKKTRPSLADLTELPEYKGL